MPTSEERKRQFEEEGRRYRLGARRQVTAYIWDNDPIKQYVRRFGWLEVIRDYLERRRRDGVHGSWKYLTLPGANASDIGLLCREGLLQQTSDGFRDVAICDTTGAEEVVSKVGGVLAYSSGPFRKAVAWPSGDLCRFFPFDVINLDLTGAVITGATTRDTALRRLVGIRWIFRLQRGQGFLLLLTASADDESARDRLEHVLADNLAREPRFRDAYVEVHGNLATDPYLADFRLLNQLVIPKVIARMARDCGYGVMERFVAKYDRPSHEMLSHSFELEFLGRRKAEKKYEPYFKEVPVDELSQQLPSQTQIRAVEAYVDFLPTLPRREPTDVQVILRDSPGLEADLTQEAESLVGWPRGDH
jgi:hypothetical protein